MSGLENVHGVVSLSFSSRTVSDVIRKLAGDAGFTLVEINADTDAAPMKSVRFSAAGPVARTPRSVALHARTATVRVENLDTGEMEQQPLVILPVEVQRPRASPGSSPSNAVIRLEE